MKCISICGAATSGKDALYKILESLFWDFKEVQRFALADLLKADINDFTKQKLGISAFTHLSEDKALIRPLMVAFGKAKRVQTQGKYWTGLVTDSILNASSEGILPIVTDCRYASSYTGYPHDEDYWARYVINSKLVYVERIDKNGSVIPPANDDEKYNNIELKKIADYHLTWNTTDDEDLRTEFVLKQLGDLINLTKELYG